MSIEPEDPRPAMNATVRTFRAPDAASALAAVKAALGPDAILIATRTVPGGVFRRPEVEVTATLGTPSEPRLPPAPAPVAAAPQRAAIRDERLASEVQQLRRSVEDANRAFATVSRQARAGSDLQIPPAAANVHARLVGHGVEPVLAEELVRQALLTGAGSHLDPLERAVRDLLGGRLVPCRAPWLQPGRQAIALVGPTGVGKTTTLAKMAARALLEAKKRVALLTVDTYRIGASEQLARYGEIMGVPALVARDRGELQRAYPRIADSDLVLVDTAGRSSAEDVARQADLVRAIPGIQLHLVVSAATGAQQLAAVAERYRALEPERLIFSKLDEAAGPGAVLSLAVRLGRPVSCVTDGQRVPEDLHALTGPELVELVLPRRDAASEEEW